MHCHVRKLSALILTALLPASPTATAQSAPAPCADAAHAQFDFWVGEWEVTRADGTPAGTSRIEKILDGCVIFENWKSAKAGFEGKSFNTYDPRTGKWSQVWVDTAGATIHFSGALKDNVMDMEGKVETADGTLLQRMSFTANPDGTIRQQWLQSGDGKAWQTLFDGIYRRKK